MGIPEADVLVNKDRTGNVVEANIIALAGDEKKVVGYLANVIECFDEKNDEVFYWVWEILYKEKDKTGCARRYRRKKCSYIIWDFLFSRAKEDEVKRVAIDHVNDYLRGISEIKNKYTIYFLFGENAKIGVKYLQDLGYVNVRIVNDPDPVDDGTNVLFSIPNY
jgi:hypothetical protein